MLLRFAWLAQPCELVPSASALQQAERSVAARARPVVAYAVSSGLRETASRGSLDRSVLGYLAQQWQELVYALVQGNIHHER